MNLSSWVGPSVAILFGAFFVWAFAMFAITGFKNESGPIRKVLAVLFPVVLIFSVTGAIIFGFWVFIGSIVIGVAGMSLLDRRGKTH